MVALFLWLHPLLTVLADEAIADPVNVQTHIKKPSAVSQIPSTVYKSTLTPELEEKIIENFSEGKCQNVRELVPPQYEQMRPLGLAVVAFCEPQALDPERLFSIAENKSPGSELIVFLHGKYRWKKNPKSAEPLWRRVLILARTPTLRRITEDYLNGVVTPEDESGQTENIAIGQTWTLFANTQTGMSRENNPTGEGFSLFGNTSTSSLALNLQAGLGGIRTTDYGSWGFNYSAINTRYSTRHPSDLFQHDLDFPIAYRAGENEDVSFRPFFEYSTVGSLAYQALSGLGVLGVAYRSHYKQSVQGSIYQDRLFPSSVNTQQGTHFRFEYNWQFYPERWFLRINSYIEHVKANNDNDPSTNTVITYSHNDLGFQFFVDYEWHGITFGIYPRIFVREDDNTSTYQAVPSGILTTKRREDYTLSTQANISIALYSGIQLLTWYEYERTYSNIGPADYQDRNSLNQIFGLALRTFLEVY